MMNISTTIMCILIATGILGTYASFFNPKRFKKPRFSIMENYQYSLLIFSVLFGIIHIIYIFVFK